MHPKEGGGGELRERARGARQREREVMFSMSSDVMRKRFVSSLWTQRIQSGALAFFFWCRLMNAWFPVLDAALNCLSVDWRHRYQIAYNLILCGALSPAWELRCLSSEMAKKKKKKTKTKKRWNSHFLLVCNPGLICVCGVLQREIARMGLQGTMHARRSR